MTVKKGFTLIELLVVIGIMAVLAAGVVALINPLEKTRQANDANVQSAVGQVASALQSYAAQQASQTATYPTAAQWAAYDDTNILVTTGELVHMPALPTNYTGTYSVLGQAASFTAPMLSAKYVQGKCAGVNAWWFWSSATGRACGVCQAAAPDTTIACSAGATAW
jgi:prepilin-type N-terminal cleavage/methylation domain-containing protein